MSLATNTLMLKVSRVRAEAKDILSLELTSATGDELPPFTPGSHLELSLGNGQTRHYSLLNDPAERYRYVIAVGLTADTRGGSRFIHETVRQGDSLKASFPRNNFPLDENAEHYCFVAGGIGITPILSMIRWCHSRGKDWRLIYAARNRVRAAFYEDLLELDSSRISFHFTDEQKGSRLGVGDLLLTLRPDEQLYCCGPDPLMQAVKKEGEPIAERLHFEWFVPPELPELVQSDTENFEVVLSRSGQRLRVGPDQTILEAVEAEGIDAPFSCRAGICGSCEVGVIAGTPEHRDFILSDEEKAANNCMMICVSRSVGPSLELDL